MKEKRENPYQAVSIPKDALEKIRNHKKQYEYKSIADFIRIAIEDRIGLDTGTGSIDIINPAKSKPSLGNLQEQLNRMQKDILELKSRKKKKIF